MVLAIQAKQTSRPITPSRVRSGLAPIAVVPTFIHPWRVGLAEVADYAAFVAFCRTASYFAHRATPGFGSEESTPGEEASGLEPGGDTDRSKDARTTNSLWPRIRIGTANSCKNQKGTA